MCQLLIRYFELLDQDERSCNAMQEMWGAYDYGDNNLLSQQAMGKYNTQNFIANWLKYVELVELHADCGFHMAIGRKPDKTNTD